jgi:galactarate dehydratase
MPGGRRGQAFPARRQLAWSGTHAETLAITSKHTANRHLIVIKNEVGVLLHGQKRRIIAVERHSAIRRVPRAIGVTIVRQNSNGQVVPADNPGEDLTAEDMARVTADDWADIRTLARGYCRTVDATRSRKRMDGSATIVKNGYAPYGTDDVSDDVCQDAVLMFAGNLRNVTKSCAAASTWVDTRETASWLYVRKDGETLTITRRTIQKWSVRDAAARNGYRLDVKPDDVDATPGAQVMRAVPRAEHIASVPIPSAASIVSQAAWHTAWQDGSDFPTLKAALFLAGEADDLGRAGILANVAQALHGGAYHSRRQVKRTHDAGAREWSALSRDLTEAREQLSGAPVEVLEPAEAGE